MEYKVDTTSAKVVKIEDERIRGRLVTFLTGLNLKDIQSAKMTIVEAVTKAEQEAGGKAAKVEVEHEGGGIQYDVFVRGGNKTTKIKIDAASGQIVSKR